MATIGYATLQIIPSLKGVTEAIDRQVEGKVVNVAIEPRVDRRATEKAGQQAKETVEKHTKQVTVEPRVDQAAAQKAGKQAGKTISDEMASSAKSSAGKDAAKAIVEGIADGVKREMPRGGVAEVFVDGLTEGIKQGIDGVGIGGEVVTTISTGIQSGNLGGAIRDAVVPAITNIGNEIRAGASAWAGGIAAALRSGDIQGATNEIGDTVRNTTDLIADIGTEFGLQLDSVREFGNTAATTLSQVGGDVQGVIETATGLQGTFNQIGDILGTVLPGKAGTAATKISAALASISIPAALAAFLIYEGGKVGGNSLQAAIDSVGADSEAGKNMLNQATAPGMGVPGASRDPIFAAPPPTIPGGGGPNASRERRGLPPAPGLLGSAAFTEWPYQTGGYTGSMSASKVAGVVHGGEYVIKASSTSGIQNAYPGLLDYLNNRGALPGFKGGGKVQLGNISATSITSGEQQSMWDAVRGKFPSAVLSSATREVMTEGHPDYHNAGRAIDISGPNMGSIAAWIASTYPDSLELIHSPFGRNIKNGQNVGDGTSVYGAATMAGHRDHVHWALGKSATIAADAGADAMAAVMGPATGPTATTSAMAQSATTSSQSMSMPGSLTGLAGMGLAGLGSGVGTTGQGGDLGLFGDAASAAVSGQVGSALSVFGVNDSPGWLKGLSSIVSGTTINGMPVAPLSASPAPATAPSMSSIHSGSGMQPGPQVVYNIAARDAEDVFIRATQHSAEQAAAKLARY